MTKREFDENILDFGDLKEVCGEIGCDLLDDVIYGSELDEYVDDDLTYVANDWGWRDIRSSLYDIDEGEDYYRRDGMLEYKVMDENDFETYKSDVYEYMEDGEYFDPDEEETEDAEDTEFAVEDVDTTSDDDDFVIDNDADIAGLFAICNSDIQILTNDTTESAPNEDNSAFEDDEGNWFA